MRVRFQRSPWDLYACFGWTLVVAASILVAGNGNYLGLALVLFLPGYVLAAALFPMDGEINWIERIALSFGLSIIVVPFLGFGLSLSSSGVTLAPLVSVLILFTIMIGCVAWWRRIRLPLAERLSVTVIVSLPVWKGYSALDKGLTVALLAGVVALAGTLLYTGTAPRGPEPSTGFFILGPGAGNSSYPRFLNASQPGIVAMSIVNREGQPVAYTLRVDLLGMRVVLNSTSGRNDTLEVNRTILSQFNITLANGQNWTQSYSFSISYAGLWKVQFLLFKGTDLSSPYRQLHLYVRVS